MNLIHSSKAGGEAIRTSRGPVQIVNSATQVEPALWANTLCAHCLDARYFEIVEETLANQFEFHHAILTDAATGATAVQPFFFVDQKILDGLPVRLREGRISRALDRLLTIRTAMVGCAVGEGQLDCTEPWAVEALAEALIAYARKSKAGIVVFKDFPAEYREALAVLARHGFKRIPSMPAATLDLDFSSFDEYMRRKLGSGFRSNLRRKLRDNEKRGSLEFRVLTDASPVAGQLLPLYLQTYKRSQFRFEKLTLEFLAQIGLRMPERTRFFLWQQDGRILAFALCLVHDGVLHYCNVGLDYSVALERHLYFVVWRDLVCWALEAGLKRIETGPLNYEAKFRLGLRLAPRDLYVRHTSPVINPFMALALPFLQPARHDPALRKFPNAAWIW